ncbi:MAG: cupin domain-containing protein [Actinomycetales bacterium]|nr:cupin domain-containing protein [Candidatus Lutibacillus vidarii]
MALTDHGPKPYVVDVEQVTTANDTFRTAAWTGEHLQMTLMSIPVGGEIGLELHEGTDQFLRIEAGQARVQMGKAKDDLSYDKQVEADWAIFVPTGWWHNVTNTGDEPLKVYSIYAPSHHPHGTVHATKADAEAAEAAEH